MVDSQLFLGLEQFCLVRSFLLMAARVRAFTTEAKILTAFSFRVLLASTPVLISNAPIIGLYRGILQTLNLNALS